MTVHEIGYLDQPTKDGRLLQMPFSVDYPVMIRDETLAIIGEAEYIYPRYADGTILCVTDVTVPDGYVLSMDMRLNPPPRVDEDDGMVVIDRFTIVGLQLLRRPAWAWSP